MSGFTSTLSESIGPYGAVAAAIITVGAAFVAVTAGVVVSALAMAIAAVDVKNRLVTLFGAMSGGSRAGGAAVVSMLDDLGDRLGVTRDSLVAITKQFMAMGMTDLHALRSQIQATAAISAAMGEEGSAAYTKLVAKTQEAIDTGAKFKVPDKQIAQWRMMGFSVSDIAKRMGTTAAALEQGLTKGTVDARKFQVALGDVAREKFGHVLAEQALEPTRQWAKFKEHVSRLFEGVDTKPFLSALSRVVALFSSDKASGKAMKAGITGTLNAILGVATRFVNWMVGAFLKIEIAALKVAIFLRPIYEWFDKLNSKYGIISKLTTGFLLLGAALLVPATIMAALVVGPFLLFWAVAGAVAAALVSVGTWAERVGSSLAGLAGEALTAAESFVSGLVEGIGRGIGRVVGAAKNLAGEAVHAVTSMFDSHSPSLVMRKIGYVGVAGGLALGMSAGAPMVRDSAARVAAVATGAIGEQVSSPSPRGNVSNVSSIARSTASSTSSSRTVNVNFAPGSIVVQGAGQSAVEITEEMVSVVFERMALEEGV